MRQGPAAGPLTKLALSAPISRWLMTERMRGWTYSMEFSRVMMCRRSVADGKGGSSPLPEAGLGFCLILPQRDGGCKRFLAAKHYDRTLRISS